MTLRMAEQANKPWSNNSSIAAPRCTLPGFPGQRWLAVFALCTMFPAGGWAQTTPPVVKRKAVPVATVRDPQTVKFFVDQFMLPEARVDSIDIIDVVGDGFNDKDVLQVYPSKQVYNLSESDTVLNVMRNWERGGFITVVGSKNRRGQFEVRSKYPVAASLFAGMARVLERTYTGKKLTIMFDYDGTYNTAELMLWGFLKDEDLRTPPDAVERFAHDLMLYIRSDTLQVPQPVYDVIFVEKVVTDTVYVREEMGDGRREAGGNPVKAAKEQR